MNAKVQLSEKIINHLLYMYGSVHSDSLEVSVVYIAFSSSYIGFSNCYQLKVTPEILSHNVILNM